MLNTSVQRTAVLALTALIFIGGFQAQAQRRRARTTVPRMKSGEISLIGVRLFDPVKVVVSRFGNPDSVQPVQVTEISDNSGGGSDNSGAQGGPPGGGGGRKGESGPGTGLPTVGGGGGSPFAPGSGAPITGGGGGGGGDSSTITSRQTMYIYLRKGITYTFIINDKGRVVQISTIAQRDSSTRTRRGITLGSSYKDVIRMYGYPETHDFQNKNTIILMKYLKSQHVAFQTFNQKVVGITVAAGTQ